MALLSFIALDYWNEKNAKPYKKLEKLWKEDVRLLNESGKMPASWNHVKEVEVIAGTPETRDWLKRIKIPLAPRGNPDHKLQALVVVWVEGGKRGTMIQYNLTNLESGDNVYELGRTLILSQPRTKSKFKEFLEEFGLDFGDSGNAPGVTITEPPAQPSGTPAKEAAPSTAPPPTTN